MQRMKFNARASRIDELRLDIEQFSDDLIEKQKLQNCIKAEAFGYVCQLQQSAAMLAPVDSDKDVETYTTRDDNDATSNYQKQYERVNNAYFECVIFSCTRSDHHSFFYLTYSSSYEKWSMTSV